MEKYVIAVLKWLNSLSRLRCILVISAATVLLFCNLIGWATVFHETPEEKHARLQRQAIQRQADEFSQMMADATQCESGGKQPRPRYIPEHPPVYDSRP